MDAEDFLDADIAVVATYKHTAMESFQMRSKTLPKIWLALISKANFTVVGSPDTFTMNSKQLMISDRCRCDGARLPDVSKLICPR